MPEPMSAPTIALIEAYYAAFNRQDVAAMLSLLSHEVLHEPSQGKPRHGRQAFDEFLAHMNRCYREPVVMASPDGARASAEFMLEGKYIASDEGLPPASGQTYRLRVGAFFQIADGMITRVSNHYNLADWTAQVEHGSRG
jgi:steroid delta-isomerase-like uncharacterized protein